MRHAAWIVLVTAALVLGDPLDAEEARPLDPDESLLAALNCGIADAPAGWKPISHWTVPARGRSRPRSAPITQRRSGRAA